MTAKVIDGKAFAAGVRGQVAEHVARLKEENGLTPGLAVVLVGEDPGEPGLRAQQARPTVEAGMNSFEHRLDASTSEAELLALIDKLNADPAVHGILVQLPLPEADRRQQGDQRDRPGQGCRRVSHLERRASGRRGRKRWCPARRSAA